MARAHPRLAKLTRPDTTGLVSRERLFSALDQARRFRFAWISGPAGMGKTSLVSTWLDQRGQTALWYRVDALDRDPANFFHYLGQAGAGLRMGRGRPLPHLTPEYLAGLQAFARRYFRELFGRLPAPAVLALDNCHEAADSPFEDLVAWALDEAPPGIAILGISRKDPGAAFARWTVGDRFVHLRTTDLRLNEDEARAIARSRGRDRVDVAPLLAKVDGWAAGFVVGLRAEVGAPDASAASQRAIFDYFTREILAAADPRNREFLVRTAVLPVFSSELAERLTGLESSATILEDLHRSHFFTERRSKSGEEPSYEYHPLFREFLLTQARADLGEQGFAAHCRQAAALLEESGRAEAAVALRIMAADWPAMIRTIVAQAPVLMQQGRWQILRGWIDALPADSRASEPWVLYWRGTCACLVDPAAARDDLQAAYRLFQKAGDPIGCVLACAGTLEAGYLQLGDQRPSLPWIDELDRLLASTPALPLEIEVRVIQALMGAWMAQPQHPMLRRWVRRATELLGELPDSRGKASLIVFATGYLVWAGDYAGAAQVTNHSDLDPRVIESDPLSALMLCIMKCGVAWQNARHREAYALIDRAQQIADASGVHVLDSFIAAQAVYTALSAVELSRAEAELERNGRLLQAGRPLNTAQHGVLAAGVSVLAGRFIDARQRIEREIAVLEPLGAPFVTATTRLQLAQILVLNGELEAAGAPLQAALEFARLMPSGIVEFQALLTSSWLSFRRGDIATGLATLREGLAIGRERGYMNCHPLWIPEMMREVLVQALDAGIEPEYVRRFIRHRRLDAGLAPTPNWPWPVRIMTLGQLEIHRDGLPLLSSGKAKQRVLEFLKALVARGPQGASSDALAELLFPEAEGDAGRDALRVALHRLRKLLGDEEAVHLTDGRIALNPAWCWVDAFAFEQVVDAARGDSAAAARALELYRGHFLPDDGDRPWFLATRDRLRSKFLRAVETRGGALAEGGDPRVAIELYRKATEIDPLAEGLYRRLMECYAGQGRHAEALETYRRCRRMLSVVLGMKPGKETEALYARLVAGVDPVPSRDRNPAGYSARSALEVAGEHPHSRDRVRLVRRRRASEPDPAR